MVELLDPSTLPLVVFVAGVALTLAEALVPGAHFIVLGGALLVAGLLGLLFPTVLGGAIAMAVVTLVVGAVSFYLYRELGIYKGGGVAKTSDSDSLKGSTGKVTERVTQDSGEVKLRSGGFNPYYRARAFDDPIEVGEEVVVVDPGGGNVVTVDGFGNLDDDEIDRALRRDRSEKSVEARDRVTTVEEPERTDGGAEGDGGGDDSGTDADTSTDDDREPEFERA